MQLPVYCLTPLGRHSLPLRQQFVSYLVAVFRRKLLPSVRPFPQSILLIGRQIVPFLQVLANLLLPPRRKVLESLIVLHEALLLRRRLVAKILHPLRRQPRHTATIASATIRAAVSLRVRRRASTFTPRILSCTARIRPRFIRTRFVRTSSARIGTRRGRRWMRGRCARARLPTCALSRRICRRICLRTTLRTVCARCRLPPCSHHRAPLLPRGSCRALLRRGRLRRHAYQAASQRNQ